MRTHVMFDLSTGQAYVIDAQGNRQPFSEEAAAAAALPDDVDLEAEMRQIMHDCPECRAALAAGEKPIIWSKPKVSGKRLRKLRRRKN